MKDYALKFKKLYVPYFLCMVGVVVGYTVFNWVFTIWLDWLPFNDDVTGFIAPAGVTIIAVVVFLKKGINSFKYKNDNGSFLLYIFGIFGIFIPTEMAQNYIETATGNPNGVKQNFGYKPLSKNKILRSKTKLFL